MPLRRFSVRRRLFMAFWWSGPFLIVALLLAEWVIPRRVPSRGGLYFPWRVEIPGPVFAQGDPRWKDDPLGSTPATLHAEGCAVSSAAMVLAGSGYGLDVDPGRLNRFLTENGGYTEEGWIYWEKAAGFEPGGAVEPYKAYEGPPSLARIDWNLLRGNPMIVRIRLPGGGTHFVVIAGKDGWDYLIRDPGAGAWRGLYPLCEIAPRIEALRYYGVKTRTAPRVSGTPPSVRAASGPPASRTPPGRGNRPENG